MAIFKYKGVNASGKTVKDTIQADDAVSLKKLLRSQGIILSDYEQLKEKRRSNFFSVSSKAKKGEFVTFCRQFAIMLTAGVSIADCLDTLRKQKFTTVFKNDISAAYEEVLKGSLLSEALQKHPKNFPNYFISMVYVGELSGNLAHVLVRAADYYDNDLKIKAKTKSAMMYPMFLSIMVVAIFFLLMIMIVPNFAKTLQGYGQELPGLTKAVLAISDFVVANVVWLLLGIAVVVIGSILFFKKTAKGKYLWSAFMMHVPVFKNIKINTITTRFGQTFAILLESGMQVFDCMKVMPRIINDKYFEKKFAYAIEEVNNGKRLSRSLENTQLFPPMLSQMVNVGENTGSLDEVLNIVGDYYQNVLAQSIQRATALLEPMSILLLGGVVLVIILAVMLPMFNMVNVKF
jgi:type IV pilus assembly protein PilC